MSQKAWALPIMLFMHSEHILENVLNQFAFIKNPPLDHNLRQPCKFLIFAINYHAKKF